MNMRMKLNHMFKKDACVLNAKLNDQFKENTWFEQFICQSVQKIMTTFADLALDALDAYNQTV